MVSDAGGEDVDRVVARAGRDVHAGGVGVLVVDRGRGQAGDRAPVGAARGERAQRRRSAPSVSAESLTLIVSKLGGFWMVRAPRMPWTLPALPTLTVSIPPLVLRLVATPVASTLTVSLPEPVVMFTAPVPAYL